IIVGFSEMTNRIFGDYRGLRYADWYRDGPVIGLMVLCMAGLVQHVIRFSRRDYRDLPGFLCLAAMAVSVGFLTFVQGRFYFMEDQHFVFLLVPAALALACLLRDLRLPVAPVVLYVALFALISAIAYANLVMAHVFDQGWRINSWAVSLALAIAVLALVVWSAFSDRL